MPRHAEMIIISMGEGFFFLTFLKMKEMATMIAKMINPLISGANPPLIVLKFKSVLSAIVIDVERIKATTQGRTPPRKA